MNQGIKLCLKKYKEFNYIIVLTLKKVLIGNNVYKYKIVSYIM